MEGNTQLLRDKNVAQRLAISKSYLWRLVGSGKVPPPTRIGKKMSVWKLSDIQPILDDPKKYLGGV